jgi:hypothetical protein
MHERDPSRPVVPVRRFRSLRDAGSSSVLGGRRERDRDAFAVHLEGTAVRAAPTPMSTASSAIDAVRQALTERV